MAKTMRELERLTANEILDDYYEDFHSLKLTERMYLWWRKFTKDSLGRNMEMAQELAIKVEDPDDSQKYLEESAVLWHIFKIIDAAHSGKFDGYLAVESNRDLRFLNSNEQYWREQVQKNKENSNE